jgi:hypothetical protein
MILEVCARCTGMGGYFLAFEGCLHITEHCLECNVRWLRLSVFSDHRSTWVAWIWNAYDMKGDWLAGNSM